MVTVEDLKGDVGENAYRMLTNDDDTVAQRAIEKAIIWVKAKFAKCGKEPDFNSEFVLEAILKRAAYELWSMSEAEGKAEDKKEDAEVLLEAVLGGCASDSSNSNTVNINPYVVVKNPPSDWHGFE
jgi:hypothetical protein